MRTPILIIFLTTTIALLSQTSDYIPFLWHDSELNGVHFEKTSMSIPVKLEGDSVTYYFQFDTGANKSFLYTRGNSDTSLVNRCINGESISSDIGTFHLIPISSNRVYQENGKTFIGTIGADFLKNKIIEIDFPNQRINILKTYTSSEYELMNCRGSYGRPTLALTIGGKKYEFLYDTGSSLFDMCTSKKLWKKWRNESSEIEEYPISSWGKINSAFKTELYSPIDININASIRIFEIWYNSNKKFKKDFKYARVSGIIGNKPFINKTIMIDIGNRKIGIKKTSDDFQ